jgi:hypothetical protein
MDARFEVFTAVRIKVTIFRVVTSCTAAVISRRFERPEDGGTKGLHLDVSFEYSNNLTVTIIVYFLKIFYHRNFHGSTLVELVSYPPQKSVLPPCLFHVWQKLGGRKVSNDHKKHEVRTRFHERP